MTLKKPPSFMQRLTTEFLFATKNNIMRLTLFFLSLFMHITMVSAQCTDTDGTATSTAGTVIVQSSASTQYYLDYCDTNGLSVYEYGCSNGSMTRTKIACRYGCYGGKCNSRLSESEHACYLKFTFEESYFASTDSTSTRLIDVEPIFGAFSGLAQDYVGEGADYTLSLLSAQNSVLSTHGASAGSFVIAEDFSTHPPRSLSPLLNTRNTSRFELYAPIDTQASSFQLKNVASQRIQLTGALAWNSIYCPRCVVGGEYGTYYKQSCCPGLTPKYVNIYGQHKFVCSTCNDRICRPSVNPPLPVSPTPTPTPSGPRGPNLLGNPGFELPLTSSASYPSTSSQVLSSWTVRDQPGDDWVMVAHNSFGAGSRPNATEGTQVLVFNSWSWAGHPGGAKIQQNVSTQPGLPYTISFKLSTWADSKYQQGDTGKVRLHISTTENSSIQINNREFVSPSDLTNWTTITCAFVAGGSLTQISLEDAIPVSEKERTGTGIDAFIVQAGASLSPGTCTSGGTTTTPTPTVSPSATPTAVPTVIPTLTPTPKPSPIITPKPTATTTPTITPTMTLTKTPTLTPKMTATVTPSPKLSPTPTPKPTPMGSPIPSSTPKV